MATVTRTATVTADAWYVLEGSSNFGNGKGTRMSVGQSSGWTSPEWLTRFAIKIPRGTLFDGVPNADLITAFNVKLRAWDVCFGIGGTVRFFLERATTAMAENSHAGDCTVNSSGTVGIARWPGPTRSATDHAGYSGSPTNGQWVTVNALALGKWWYANPSVTELVLVAVAANSGLTAEEESNAARRVLFYTAQTSSAPYAEMSFSDNLAPYAPSDLLPVDGSKSASVAGTTATVSGRHLDPEGNTATKYQAQLFPTGTTDGTADATTPTKDNTVIVSTAHNAVRSHQFTGLAGRTSYEWRMRFYDGQWGPWSLLLTIATAYKPSAVSLTVEPGTLTPHLYASVSSGDAGDFVTAVTEEIYQDQAGGGSISKWTPGKQTIGGSPTRSDVTYAGSALAFTQPYRRVTTIYNRDDIASDPVTTTFTELAASGPNVSPGNTLTKQNTLTPTVTLTDPGNANIDQARVEWLNEAGDTVLSDTGITSFTSAASRNVTAPAGIYNYGDEPRLRAYVRVTGNANLGPARTVQIRLNAKPGSPYPLTVGGSGQTVHRADGVWVTTDSTPDVTLPFRDEDKDLGYTEAPVRREVEIRTMADAHFSASPYIITSGITEVYTAPALTVETQYKVRGRYDDNANVRSDFSDYALVKYSAAPTLSAVTPANAATVTDPSPDVAWTYASSGSKAQAEARLIVSLGTTVLYDTGWVGGTGASFHVPAFILPNAASISWVLEVRDSDGLSSTISRTFTTSFATPSALTGLTIVADDDEKALLATWTPSSLTVNEFEAYYVYARAEGGQFRLVATIVDKNSSSLLYKAAGHNKETIIRVTQTNGWAESAPTEESGTLTAEGHWIRSASKISELQYVTGHGGDSVTDIEEMAPVGRAEKLLLTWGTTGYEGEAQLKIGDRALLNELRAYKEAAEIVMIKFPYGAVRYARITDTPDNDEVADWATQRVRYIEVTAESANF